MFSRAGANPRNVKISAVTLKRRVKGIVVFYLLESLPPDLFVYGFP